MYRNRKSFIAVLITIVALSWGCKDDPPSEVTLPSNLEISFLVDTIDHGTVAIEAKADKANFYTCTFSEGTESTTDEASDGLFSYTYSEAGTYDVVVKAHATESEFIQQEESVTITFPVPGNEGDYPTAGYSTPTSYSGYDLVWQDEFDGNSLNSSDWNYEIGTGSNGWGNNELQYYTEDNASVSDGYLTIEAKEQFFNGNNYTSSRITTLNKQSFKYGRIDIRAAMPFGQGMWPALWMLGQSFPSAGWPYCGEIDIMEMAGGNAAGKGDNVVLGTIHWDNNGTYANYGDKTTLSTGTLADEFHVYTIKWDETAINWYLDDQLFNSVDITPSGLSEFHEEFFFIFNVAVGGDFSGSPDSSTEFPQKMFVDYVRVFQEQ
ncbi:MAG: glycoside hydrolase family 16 protein [Flavobacteriales bacterium]|nr:glycoside hydrolase family 16 protein [Flavobacteriales bacterium]